MYDIIEIQVRFQHLNDLKTTYIELMNIKQLESSMKFYCWA